MNELENWTCGFTMETVARIQIGAGDFHDGPQPRNLDKTEPDKAIEFPLKFGEIRSYSAL